MLIILFIVGPPGSGKSEAYRIICSYLRGQRVERINDYAFLLRMYEEDVQHVYFYPMTENKGLTVKDFQIVNRALEVENKQIRAKADDYTQSTRQDDFLLIVEFSRNNYHLAFDHFDIDIVANALFLFITAEKRECHIRLEKRVTEPPTEDNHNVPPEILRDYYDKALPYTPDDLFADFGVPLERSKVIDNNGTKEQFRERIGHFIDTKFRQ